MSSKILVLPGDGIGVEVADQAIRVIEKLNEQGLKEMNKKRVYKSLINTLNSIHKRLSK